MGTSSASSSSLPLALAAAKPRSVAVAAARAGHRPPPWRRLPRPPPPESRGGIASPCHPLSLSPPPGRRRALGRRKRPPPAPRTPLLCFTGEEREGGWRRGYFAQNPLPFPLFYKEPFHSFTLFANESLPFFIFANKPFHHKSIISIIPLYFSRVAPMFSKITTKPLPLKNIYKKALEPPLDP